MCDVNYGPTTGIDACSHNTCNDADWCNNQGTAEELTASPFCKCTCTGNYAGDHCTTCKAGTVGANCEQTCPGTTPGVAENAACTCVAGATEASCTCAEGAFGPACDCTCGAGMCGDNGKCAADDTTVCACECNTGYAGAQCEITCPRTNGLVCNGGQCQTDGTCTCATPYAGEACDRCDGSHWGPDCVYTCPGTTKPCSGNGECQDDGTCKCKPGFANIDCSATCPTNNGKVCNHHGSCTIQGTCQCHNGFVGAACEGTCGVDAEQTCPEGWFLGGTNKCFARLETTKVGHSLAEAQCAAAGGSLATADSQAEWDALARLVVHEPAWFGIVYNNAQSAWEWANGESGALRWDAGEPKQQKCAVTANGVNGKRWAN